MRITIINNMKLNIFDKFNSMKALLLFVILFVPFAGIFYILYTVIRDFFKKEGQGSSHKQSGTIIRCITSKGHLSGTILWVLYMLLHDDLYHRWGVERNNIWSSDRGVCLEQIRPWYQGIIIIIILYYVLQYYDYIYEPYNNMLLISHYGSVTKKL